MPPKSSAHRKWFDNCGGWSPQHDLKQLRRGIAVGWLNEQDEYGMTALMLAVTSAWSEGIAELLQAGADTELRYHRTGETALYHAMHRDSLSVIEALSAAGADPDARNHYGVTPRDWAERCELTCFDHIARQDRPLPAPRIQNAEHLADHYHPRFKIPDRPERETTPVGRAVDLCVFGPRSEGKQETVKVRVTARRGRRPQVRYTATVETPIKQTHLTPDTTEVEFGPEHIATVYVPRKGRG